MSYKYLKFYSIQSSCPVHRWASGVQFQNFTKALKIFVQDQNLFHYLGIFL